MSGKRKLNVTLAFWSALIAVLIIVVMALVFSARFEDFTGFICGFLNRNFGWLSLYL